MFVSKYKSPPLAFSRRLLWPTVIEGFGGLDLLNPPALTSNRRSPDAINRMTTDSGHNRKRFGSKRMWGGFGACSDNIHWFTEYHVGSTHEVIWGTITQRQDAFMVITLTIYKRKADGTGATTTLYSSGIETKLDASNPIFSSFMRNSKMYILTGKGYLVYSGGTTIALVSDHAYIPKALTGCNHLGAGVIDEQLNRLTKARRYGYITDNSNTDYYVHPNCTGIYSVILNGQPMVYGTNYTYNLTTHCIHFNSIPGYLNGSDNMELTFIPTADTFSYGTLADNTIDACTIMTTYGLGGDTRYVFSGNASLPYMDWWSDTDAPDYFPYYNYQKVGDAGTAIQGYFKKDNALLIFKESSPYDATIYLRTAVARAVKNSDGTQTINQFDLVQGMSGEGAINKNSFALVRDEPLFLTKQGVKTVISNAVTQTRNLQDRSNLINSELTTLDLSNAVAISFNDRYYLAIGGTIYVADPRLGMLGERYEWQKWTGLTVTAFAIIDNELWFAKSDANSSDALNPYIPVLCKFIEAKNDDGVAIRSYWTTPWLNMGSIFYRKRLLSLGTGVSLEQFAKSSAELSFAIDGSEFYTSREAVFNTDYDNKKDSIAMGTAKKVRPFLKIKAKVENNALNEDLGLVAIQLSVNFISMVKGDKL